ncbi:thioredoxin [Lichenihabitans sp. Uapishka_5]|uniref:thioredoxin n=1 Tax=Lichenihabitans sp. Uapishka_5 TaxID=3037302 RepID=UPI0029E7F6CD|nr:thioredoxin [Lichenihabitans sp. Uapishka_5]MDX7951595.1 thioredoxin [Lichenihabitans sp. Uapishka_5]
MSLDSGSAIGFGAAGSTAAKDVTTASFRQDVVTESMTQPVLVDFWAPWCGPCKQLGPVIEKVVAATEGKVKLVKMNIDEHPQIAGQLGIQSIPAVIAFQKGQPVDGFVGALPETQIKGFIERLVGPLGDPLQALMDEAEAAESEGDAETAMAIYAEVLASDETHAGALAALAKLQLAAGEIEQAKAVLSMATGAAATDPAIVAMRAAVDLAEQSASLGDLPDLQRKVDAAPDDHQARFDLAVALNGKDKRVEAVDALIAILQREQGWNDDAARKQLLQFFEAWGPMDKASVAGRRKLSGLLFR